MTSDGRYQERTSLAGRRTLLSLIVNGALLLRMPTAGLITGPAVLAIAAFVYLASRRILTPARWALLVTLVGLLDLVTLLSAPG
jgi:hypothetical protein